MTVLRGRTARVNGVRLHYLEGPSGPGPLVVLLHGWPQTCHMWRYVLPRLAADWATVATDLRGYGRSDKPAGGYDKRTMAGDVRALVRHLGHERIVLIGHDRGARVAHRYALDYPREVERLALLDIIPTREVMRRMDAALARGYWHWLFHFQPDLPEALVGSNVEAYLRWIFEQWTYRHEALDEATIAHYLAAFRSPGALRAGFEDYRATLGDDMRADDASAASGQRLAMPLLALWGQEGLVGRLPVREIWSEYADDLRAEALADCGHFLAEEQPDLVVERLQRFLAER
jgi:haloacetate dehalogenase